jgi:hypothetical protein
MAGIVCRQIMVIEGIDATDQCGISMALAQSRVMQGFGDQAPL